MRPMVLFVGVNPPNTKRLYLDQELSEIRKKHSGSTYRENFDIDSEWCVSLAELPNIILKRKPTVLHVSGHGSEDGGLILDQKSGPQVVTSPEILRQIFEHVQKEGVRCVVLNYCYSARLASDIVSYVGFSIGYPGNILDKAAWAFSSGFYTGLGEGKSFSESFDHGTLQIKLQASERENSLLPLKYTHGSIGEQSLLPVGQFENTNTEARKSNDSTADATIDAIYPSKESVGDLVIVLEDLLNNRQRGRREGDSEQTLTQRIFQLEHDIKSQWRLFPDSIVAGARLISVIGRGNFGTVWLSKRVDNAKLCAVKIFHADNLTQGAMLWRFRRSIEAIKRLNKDREAPVGIIRLQSEDASHLAFSMDYHSSGNLEDIAKCRWTIDEKIDIFIEICQAVKFTHQRGVIHRDIKPGNVILTDKCRPILTDFDIADIQFASTLSVATKGGLGTPCFAAPEQIKNAEHATRQSDVYSLGRLLYFMLLEHSPGLQYETDPSLDDLADYPPALTAIIRKATQYAEARRHTSVGELIGELQEYKTGWAALTATLSNAGRWMSINRFAVLAGLLVCAFLFFLNIYQNEKLRHEREKLVLQRTINAALSELVSGQDEARRLQFKESELQAKITSIQERLSKGDSSSPEQRQYLDSLRNEMEKTAEAKIANEEKLVKLRVEAERARRRSEAPMAPGCFPGETRIALADGGAVRISDIHEGMIVRSIRTKDLSYSTSVVTKIHAQESESACWVNSVQMTGDQPLWTERGWIPCAEITIGDKILNSKRLWIKIERHRLEHKRMRVYSLTVEPNHMFFAEDLLVHNKPA